VSALDTHDGWLQLGARLDLPVDPWDRWVVDPGARAVLVLYSNGRQRPGSFDKAVANDELVVELDPERLSPGAHIPIEGVPAHYQQGSAILTFETIDVVGALEVRAWDGRRLSGVVSVTGRSPRLDQTNIGSAQATLMFDVSVKTAG
jgi:hypothetical protein